MDVISWLSANWLELVGVAGTVVMGASIVVKALAKYTETKTDDEIGDKLTLVYEWLSKLALNTPKKTLK